MNAIKNKFEIGKKYTSSSICDSGCVWVFEVTKRTAKTITVRSHQGTVNEATRTKRIKFCPDGVEYIMPLGSYSMAPYLGADKVVE